ncbi:hypothetical protein V6N13_061012 [Hibiscus sabdariffa]|uniref:Uncharacterized protein n=1 Tax=Hibiscus sabdariffa TaxID=183260 RepID=A0ABR2N8Y4_9ROSI
MGMVGGWGTLVAGVVGEFLGFREVSDKELRQTKADKGRTVLLLGHGLPYGSKVGYMTTVYCSMKIFQSSSPFAIANIPIYNINVVNLIPLTL